MELNVLRFASPEQALQMAKDGDSVYFPGLPGIHPYRAPAGGFRITKSLEIRGDGPGDPSAYHGTVFQPADPVGDPPVQQDVFTIAPDGPGTIASVRLRDFKIKTPPTGRHGIRCVLATGQRVRSLVLDGVSVFEVGGNAFHLEGASLDADPIRMLSMSSCVGSFAGGLGAWLAKTRCARLLHSAFGTNAAGGVDGAESGIALYRAGVDDNGWPTGVIGQLKFTAARFVRIDAAHVEHFAPEQGQPHPVPVGCEIVDCVGGCVIGGSAFANDAPDVADWGSCGLRVTGDSGAVAILPNAFTRVQPTLVEVGAGAANCALLPQFNDPRTGSPGPPVGEVSISGTASPVVAMPYVRRIPGEAAESSAGLVGPSSASPPTTGVTDGMLYYSESLRVLLIRRAGAWAVVETTP